MRYLLFSLTLLPFYGAFAQSLHEPTFEDILSLATVSQPQISPDGQHVVYVRQTTDWADNRYDRELWLAKAGLPPFQLTKINQASTPTLIQHGEFDRRVPIANAYELYQGLQDVGVPTKLIVYKDFGHGITRPRERLAAMQHNWDWFDTYLWKAK